MAYNYIPKYIRQSENKSPKGVVTASRWNELFNLLIQQGDHTAEELGNILNYFSTRLVDVESEIAESAEAIANIREAFRINVTSSNGVYTADKTFDEIKTAYDAGQLPYVVLTGDTLDLVYTLAYFSVPNVSGQGFVAFERYLIGEDTLETETLRIYSYTTASGSNIVKRTSSFDVSCGNGVVSFVDEEGGASIAQFTLNQTEDCEINVNTLTARLGTKVNNLETSLSNNYRTSAEQDVIDSTKLTDAPTDGKEYARKNGSWQEVVGGGGTSDHSQLTNRDAANQHPITAITGLQTALDGKADAAELPTAINTALAQAKASGEFDGADGKSAYQYAVEGGYTGTETEFAKKLASGTLIVHVTESNGTLSADKSFIEIRDAILVGIPVIVDYSDVSLPLTAIFVDALWFGSIQCDSGGASNGAIVATVIIEITQNGEVNDISAQIDIPSAVTDDHINSLIDTKLGVIENGSY